MTTTNESQVSVARACPFARRDAWAVYKVGHVWRVLRPSRGWACHEQDAWSGDFTSHAEALVWATDTQRRARWLSEHAPAWPEYKRIGWIEGLTAECKARNARSAAILSRIFGDPQ